MKRALTFENVLVTVVAFAVLTGGVAYASAQLGKNSVGKKQLKANSVTAAKIKKNAVVTAKLKKGAVTSVKVKDGSIGATAFAPATTPFSGAVARLAGSGSGSLSEPTKVTPPVEIPLTGNVFVQQPGETDYLVGQAQMEFTGKCTGQKLAFVTIYYDTTDSLTATAENRELARGGVYDFPGTEPNSLTVPIGYSRTFPKVTAPTSRNLSAFLFGTCPPGAGKIVASNVQLEVIGLKE